MLGSRRVTTLNLHFGNRPQPDRPLSAGVHRVVREAAGTIGVGDAAQGALLVQVCCDRRGLWLQVPAGVRGVHVNGRPVRRMAMLRAGDAIHVDGVELVVRGEQRPPYAGKSALASAAGGASDASDTHANDPRVVLRGVGGQHHGRSFTLGAPRTVGSARDADIRIDAPAFAAQHARLERHDDVVLLHDLGSPEGSVVNGLPARDAVLHAGDQVVFDAQHRFVVEVPALPASLREEAAVNAAADARLAEAEAAVPQRRASNLRWPWLLLSALLIGLGISALLWFGAG